MRGYTLCYTPYYRVYIVFIVSNTVKYSNYRSNIAIILQKVKKSNKIVKMYQK